MTSTDVPAGEIVASNVLEGDMILLRRVRIADAEALNEAILESGPELSQTMSWWHSEFSLDEAGGWAALCESWWDEGRHFEFAIRDRASDAYLGSCGLGPIQPGARVANLS